MGLSLRVLLVLTGVGASLLTVGQTPASGKTCDDELLKVGSAGACVTEMKELLNKNCTPATRLTAKTDYFGPQTKIAVYNMQKLRFPDNTKRHTGMVGRNAWSALRVTDSKTTDCQRPIDNPAVAAQPTDPSSTPGAVSATASAVWDKVAQCESGGKWNTNTGNGYYGGLQFSPATWRAYGGQGLPHEAPKEQQIRIAQKTLAEQGPNAWPTCSKKAGLTQQNGR